jgi:hypothetical protein
MQHLLKVVPWLSTSVTGFPPQWPGFEPTSGHVGLVMDKASLGQVSPSTSVPRAKHSTDCSMLIVVIVVIIRGGYNKPIVFIFISVALVREQTILTEQLLLVGEDSANF